MPRARGIRKRAETDAASVIRATAISRPPVNIVRVAAALCVNVLTAAFDNRTLGAMRQKPGSDAEIFVSADLPKDMQRWVVAHELGHHLQLALQGRSVMNIVDRADCGVDDNEYYANEFAGHLLMPGTLLKRYRRDPRSVPYLSYLFGVPERVMAVCLTRRM